MRTYLINLEQIVSHFAYNSASDSLRYTYAYFCLIERFSLIKTLIHPRPSIALLLLQIHPFICSIVLQSIVGITKYERNILSFLLFHRFRSIVRHFYLHSLTDGIVLVRIDHLGGCHPQHRWPKSLAGTATPSVLAEDRRQITR